MKDMNKIKLFENPEFGKVRVVMDENNEPLFCLSDVCKVLDLCNVSQVKARLNDGVISNEIINDSLGREQQATFINEDALYDVIFDSRKPEAKQFRKWVVSEVLPSIRKTGGYVASTEMFIESYFGNLDDQAKKFLVTTLDDRKRLLEENNAKQQRIEQMQPKEEFYDAVTGSSDTIDMRTVATVLNLGIGRNKIFEILRNNKVLDSKNTPYQAYIDRGYFRTVETSYVKNDGMVCINIKTVVFQSGLNFIRKIVTNNLKNK